MVYTVFVNENDKGTQILGKALYTLLNKTFFVFTRFESDYPLCTVENTLNKIKEIAEHSTEDRIVIAFGVRLLPDNLKEIEDLVKKNKGNLVFLKRLKGSKTWSFGPEGKLSFDNERIADTGIFVIQREELINTKLDNFNSLIFKLVQQEKLFPVMVKWWLFSQKKK
jgi:hypothetical protein